MFLHTTHAHLHTAHGHRLIWRSRDHRKGRHPEQVDEGKRREEQQKKRFRWWGFELWNISYLVAIFYLLGSIAWVINGFFVFLPSISSRVREMNEGSGVSAFVGGSLFQCGSLAMILEALNRESSVCFGKALDDKLGHHRKQRHGEWKWVGARWNEIGYDASVLQMFAATVFYISTITGIPGVIDMNNVGLADGIFWTPQAIGGTGFVLASLAFIFETQPTWWKIQPTTIGWHVGVFNLIGSAGFLLCGVFGYFTWGTYQSGCSTFWGSWAFLIGSYLQLLECLNRR